MAAAARKPTYQGRSCRRAVLMRWREVLFRGNTANKWRQGLPEKRRRPKRRSRSTSRVACIAATGAGAQNACGPQIFMVQGAEWRPSCGPTSLRTTHSWAMALGQHRMNGRLRKHTRYSSRMTANVYDVTDRDILASARRQAGALIEAAVGIELQRRDRVGDPGPNVL